MEFCSLGSGSSGNSFIVKKNETVLMVDCGFGLKETIDRLEKYQINPSEITAILLTHEHEDHIKGAFILANKFQIPIYLSYGTYQMSHKKINDGYKIKFELINNFDAFMIDNISVSPMPVPHDAREPLQYRFDYKDKSIAIITDLGKITKHVVQKLSRINLLVLEFNHDEEMLRDSDYPASLKKRINGEYGHLENKESLKLLASISHSDLAWVIAAHLSEKNNKIELVKKMIFEIVDKHKSNVGVIDQDLGLEWIST